MTSDQDIEAFCTWIRDHSGYDFLQYQRVPLRKCVESALKAGKLASVSEALDGLATGKVSFDKLLSDLTVTTSAMFRNPAVFASLVRDVFPYLRTYARLKIWHAGCSTGEEVYSLAILLEEHGLLSRARIYATDINPAALAAAKAGIYPLRKLKKFSQSYFQAGGSRSLAGYLELGYDFAKVQSSLAERVLFSKHDLVADGAFGEMQLILCRNVLIYFSSELQQRALQLFRGSLCPGGFLCLGTAESIPGTAAESGFKPHVKQAMIYRLADRA